MSLLRCENVTVRFGGVVACDSIHLEVAEGKIVGLIGPNGAGKTTLFNVLSRFQDLDAGEIYYRDRPISRLKASQIVRLGIARTFQNINLFAEQSVMDNILIGGHRHLGNAFAHMFALPAARRSERRIEARAVEIAEMLHLEDELDTAVGNLAYGYQKRVEFAHALAAQPEIMLLDEPVAGCNDAETAELEGIVRWINQSLGITVLLVEHDMSMVMGICDYVYVIDTGTNLAAGTPSEVQSNREVIVAYLGEADA